MKNKDLSYLKENIFRVNGNDIFTNKKSCVKIFIYDEYEVNMHTHDVFEINIVLSGNGIHYIENQNFPVSCGNVFVLPPSVLHGYINENSLKVYHIVISNEFFNHYILDIKKLVGYTTLFEIEPFLRTKLDNSFFLHLNSSQMELFNNDLNRLTEYELIECDTGNAVLKHIKTLEIIAYLSNLINSKNDTTTYSQNEYANSIINVLEYIHTNFSEKITIKDLSEIAHMSRSTFLRHFNTLCKCNPIKYITDYRISRAKILIAEQKLSKTQIAQNCGFYDSSHLNKFLDNRNN